MTDPRPGWFKRWVGILPKVKAEFINHATCEDGIAVSIFRCLKCREAFIVNPWVSKEDYEAYLKCETCVKTGGTA